MSLKPWQQATYRPLVRQAWEVQCHFTGRKPSDAQARDAWYRDTLESTCHIHSTREAGDKEYKLLLGVFTRLSEAGDRAELSGWTDKQNACFHDLADAAWCQECKRRHTDGIAFHEWLDMNLAECDIYGRTAPDKVKSFDRAMAHLAIMAGDFYWIERTSSAGETRLRWQISRFMEDLAWIEGEPVTWDYILAIHDQAGMLPADIGDATAQQLWKLLQMLDTHIRRLCRKRDIHPSDLPTR